MKSYYFRFLNRYHGSYTKQILDEALDLLGDLWPYLVLGILLTTLIKLYISKDRITEFLRKNKGLSIPFASLLGVISPVGSYIVIPLSAALYTTGVPLPLLMAFLVSSPLINPTLFLLTNGAMGIEIALARVFAALILGISAGYITSFLMKRNLLNPDIQTDTERDQFIAKKLDVKLSWRRFGKEVYGMTKYISKFFFLAIFLAAAMKILTPPNLMMKIFSGNNFMSVLLSTSAGIPFYVCGGAAIPVVMGLADLGLSKGAVLAFFISGPVTKLSNLILMYSIFKRRVFLIYLSMGILGAILLGFLFNLI